MPADGSTGDVRPNSLEGHAEVFPTSNDRQLGTGDCGWTMADKILITGISFYGRHGVRDEERILGQRFLVDVELSLDLRPAGGSDDLALTVDYADVVKRIAAIGRTRQFHLIEALAEAIAKDLLERYRIEETRVRVMKCAPPLEDCVGSAGVEIVRRHEH
jgi:7,8-dihydroneopterin aldolase/epimerase/oxygenase